MNPSYQNYTNSTTTSNITTNVRNQIENVSVQPRIETTQYNANPSVTNQGYNTGFQTVSFNQQARVQPSNSFGYRNVFKLVEKKDVFFFREDLEKKVNTLMSFRQASFDPEWLVGKKQLHTCPKYLSSQDNIVFKEIDGRTVFHDNICDEEQTEEEDKLYAKGFKIMDYTRVLKDRKQIILDMENSNFEHELHADNIFQNLKSLILKSAERAIDYSISFQQNFYNSIGRNILNSTDIEHLQKLLKNLIDENKNLNFKNIGARPELKQQYISFAIFLLSYRSQNNLDINFSELENMLKSYIQEIFTIRQETVNNYTEWLSQLIVYYKEICNAGNLNIDNTFLSTINVNLFGETRIEYRENSEWMLKYNQLLVQYNTEINNLNLTIVNMRKTPTTDLQVQEVIIK